MIKRFFLVSIYSFVWIMTVLSLNIYYYGHFYRHAGGVFTILRGTNLSDIAMMLEEKGVIQEGRIFKIYVWLHGKSRKVRAGDYSFPADLSSAQVLHYLLQGDFRVYSARVIEGWNMREIAVYLENRGLVEQKEFLSACKDQEFIKSLGIEAPTLEGYLFPDTYQTYKLEQEKELITRFVGQFRKVFTEDLKERARVLGMTPHQVVTLASIVEKESGNKSERGLISSVFHNRLKTGIPLAADPTVIYGLPHFDGNLKRIHLQIPHPYNTYINKGLPPGPIANPGKDAIMAALYPEETKYLYFVSKNDGSHYFSETFEEHNRAVQEYQVKGLRSPPAN